MERTGHRRFTIKWQMRSWWLTATTRARVAWTRSIIQLTLSQLCIWWIIRLASTQSVYSQVNTSNLKQMSLDCRSIMAAYKMPSPREKCSASWTNSKRRSYLHVFAKRTKSKKRIKYSWISKVNSSLKWNKLNKMVKKLRFRKSWKSGLRTTRTKCTIRCSNSIGRTSDKCSSRSFNMSTKNWIYCLVNVRIKKHGSSSVSPSRDQA